VLPRRLPSFFPTCFLPQVFFLLCSTLFGVRGRPTQVSSFHTVQILSCTPTRSSIGRKPSFLPFFRKLVPYNPTRLSVFHDNLQAPKLRFLWSTKLPPQTVHDLCLYFIPPYGFARPPAGSFDIDIVPFFPPLSLSKPSPLQHVFLHSPPLSLIVHQATVPTRRIDLPPPSRSRKLPPILDHPAKDHFIGFVPGSCKLRFILLSKTFVKFFALPSLPPVTR